MKYFWKISIEDIGYKRFLQWLEKCEAACLAYTFVVVKRIKGSRTLYGFSDFEVIEDDTLKCFEYTFEDDDILCEKISKWRDESECLLLPFFMLGYLKTHDLMMKMVDDKKNLDN